MNKFLLSVFIAVFCCVFSFAQGLKPLRIIERPKPEMPLNAGTLDAQESFIFRVEFLSNGQIGVISPILAPHIINLPEKATDAIRKIKFEPMTKDGIPVTTASIIRYSYSREFGGWRIDPGKFEVSKKDNKKFDVNAEDILKKAVQNLGGDKYLQAKTQIGRGRFAQLRDGAVISFQSFVDVISFPDKERTEFKNGGVKTVQTNVGNSGWIFDGGAETISDQNAKQIEDYKHGIRVSLDSLLRGAWRGNGVLTYVGKRQGTLGKRNDVIKLTFPDEFAVEFEFNDEGLPVKTLYNGKNGDGADSKEEDRYAQFADIDGIKTPFIIDRFSDGVQTSRINYESVEFNKKISDSIFSKPKTAKEAKKDVKF